MFFSRVFLCVFSMLLLSAATLVAPVQVLAAPLEIVSRGHHQIDLEVQKGRLLKLKGNASTVFVADPTVADIQVKSPSLIYVIGKSAGETTLYAVDGREQVLASIDLSVSHNLGQIERVVSALHPEAEVTVMSVGDTVVIDGIVDNASSSRKISGELLKARSETRKK
jgi:pilus assembly protein CpaC